MEPEETQTSDGSEYNLVEPLALSLFNDPDGDVILRTSDDKDFQVSKVILKFASPVFRTMFSLPQPSPEDSENRAPLPIIPISESSTTVDLILRLCYPIEQLDFANEDVVIILDVLLAGLKYEIDAVLIPVREAFKKRVKRTKYEAMTGFALAAHRKLRSEVRLAAKACLKWPLLQIRKAVVPGLELISAMDYVDLLEYHERAGQAVAELFTSYDFLSGPCSIVRWSNCSCGTFGKWVTARRMTTQTSEPIRMRSWWEDWSNLLIASLRDVPLGVEVVSLSTLSQFLLSRGCEKCRKETMDKWETGRNAMIDAIKAEVDKVELKLGWM